MSTTINFAENREYTYLLSLDTHDNWSTGHDLVLNYTHQGLKPNIRDGFNVIKSNKPPEEDI